MAEAQSTVSAREFIEWQEIHRVSPIGPERADLRAALIAATIAQAHSSRAVRLEDFVLKWGRRVRQTPAQVSAAIKQWAMAYAALGNRE